MFRSIGHFGFFLYIAFAMHLNTMRLDAHSKRYVFRKFKITYNLNEGSSLRGKYIVRNMTPDFGN